MIIFDWERSIYLENYCICQGCWKMVIFQCNPLSCLRFCSSTTYTLGALKWSSPVPIVELPQLLRYHLSLWKYGMILFVLSGPIHSHCFCLWNNGNQVRHGPFGKSTLCNAWWVGMCVTLSKHIICYNMNLCTAEFSGKLLCEYYNHQCFLKCDGIMETSFLFSSSTL